MTSAFSDRYVTGIKVNFRLEEHMERQWFTPKIRFDLKSENVLFPLNPA